MPFFDIIQRNKGIQLCDVNIGEWKNKGVNESKDGLNRGESGGWMTTLM